MHCFALNPWDTGGCSPGDHHRPKRPGGLLKKMEQGQGTSREPREPASASGAEPANANASGASDAGCDHESSRDGHGRGREGDRCCEREGCGREAGYGRASGCDHGGCANGRVCIDLISNNSFGKTRLTENARENVSARGGSPHGSDDQVIET